MAARKPRSKSKPAPVEYYFDSLEYHYHHCFGGYVHLTHIRIAPSDNDPDNYELVEVGPDNESLNPKQLPRKVVARLDALLRGLRVPIRPPFACGLDGHTTSLRIRAGHNVTTLEWWCEPIEGWKKLAAVVDAIMQAADRVGVKLPKPGD